MYWISVKQSEDNKVTPTKGDTLASIAASDKCDANTTWQHIALYNWGSAEPREVNRALVELVGCSAVDPQHPERSVLDPALGAQGFLYAPKKWTAKGLRVEQAHAIKVRTRKPVPAVAITRLDKWFVPETESCDVGYQLEGVAERADKLDFVVHASNYAKATVSEADGFASLTWAACDVPILEKRAFKTATARSGDTVSDWKGESEATDGALKPRASKKRYVNVACSPYTVTLRYYKHDDDRDARVVLAPFWVRWTKADPVTDPWPLDEASLKVKYTVKGSSRLKAGVLLIVDKDDKPVFRKPLKDSDLTKDSEVTCDAAASGSDKYWLDGKSKADLTQSAMPYRVQLQAHSLPDEDEGVAVAAMHTEVRLFAHKETFTHVKPVEDSQSFKFTLAPFRPEGAAPSEGTDEWYKLKLAEAGFHPGPVNTAGSTGDTDPYQVALAEFQRSYPKEETAPYTRLACDGAKNAPTKVVLARTDVADAAAKAAADLKLKTALTLSSAGEAKAAAETLATDADAAKSPAEKSATDAASADTEATQSETDAVSARDAAGTARTRTNTAADAHSGPEETARQTAQSALEAAREALTRATTAAQAGATVLEKATAARESVDAARTKVGAAKGSALTAASRVEAGKTHADDAKSASGTAPGSVTTPVNLAAGKAATAHSAMGSAKSAAETAASSADAAVDATQPALDAATQARDALNALKEAAQSLVSHLESSAFTEARSAAETLEQRARTAADAAGEAKTRADTLKTTAARVKSQADSLKPLADQASSDAAAVSPAAKDADDEAEKDRVAKADRKATMDAAMRPARKWFGNPADRADYTQAQGEALLTDKSKSVILWVDDKHYYTEDTTIAAIAMGDYRGGMSIGDGKVATDQKSIARPWIPLQASLALLGKAQPLDVGTDPPEVTDAMRRAVGSLRVDWSFEELPPEYDHIPGAPDVGAIQAAKDAMDLALAARDKAKDVWDAAKAATADGGLTRTSAIEARKDVETAHTRAGTANTHAGTAKTQADLAHTRAGTLRTAVNLAKQRATYAKSEQGQKDSSAASNLSSAIAGVATPRSNLGSAIQAALNAATGAHTDLLAAQSAAGTAQTNAGTAKTRSDDAKGKADTTKNQADNAPSPDTVKNPVTTAQTDAGTAQTDAGTARTDIDQLKTDADTAVNAALTAKNGADGANNDFAALPDVAEPEGVIANVSSFFGKLVDTIKGTSQDDEAKLTDLLNKLDLLIIKLGTLQTDAGTAQTEAGDLVNAANTARGSAETSKNSATTAVSSFEAADSKAYDEYAERWADHRAKDGAHTDAANRKSNIRTRKYMSEVLSERGMGKKVGSTVYTNCPGTKSGKDYGGIRPESIGDYYKAPFGITATRSLRPWLAADDTTNKVVCSVAHDDVGQDEAKVFAPALGRAGIYLNPSRIAGDGYRFRAQVSFKALPGGASHPNREALEQRYPRPPQAHTAGVRIWRRAAIRGYVSWAPSVVAGWEATLDAVRDNYAHAHVHLVHENAASPQRYDVGATITAQEYKDCVDAKLDGGGAYAGVGAKYTAGYIWPYLHKPHLAINRRPENLDAFVSWLYGTIEETSWDQFSNELIHLLIAKVEKTTGRQRGHLFAEFLSSPPIIAVEYKCTQGGCPSVVSEVVNDPTSGTTYTYEGTAIPFTLRQKNKDCLRKASHGCGGKYTFSKQRNLHHLPLCAIGRSVGGCWLYTPRSAETWVHEAGHHRHLEHARAWAGKNAVAPGGKEKQHDSRENDLQTEGGISVYQKAWDRYCIMSYDKTRARAFCGKCLLKNRGWRVEDIANPAKAVQDD